MPGQRLKLPVIKPSGDAKLPASYQVQEGDTLFSVAYKFNLELASLLQWNQMTAATQLQSGQTTISPGSSIVFIMNTVAEQHADSVGAILRQSREAKGLTTAQVAKQLNLKVSVIEQIEAEQSGPCGLHDLYAGLFARLCPFDEIIRARNFASL